ncbi:Nucleolar protein 6 [Sergentomyia squamirostris]
MKRKNFVSIKNSGESGDSSTSATSANEISDSDGDADPELVLPVPMKTPKIESKNKRAKLDMKKAPTAHEINELKEASNLCHSNLFKMQVEEMLKEIKKIQNKHRSFIEDWVVNFNKFLKKLTSGKEKLTLNDTTWLKNTKFPLDISFLNETKGSFQFVPPKKSAQIIGSQKLGTILGSNFIVDISVEIPKEFFQTADYLNMIYHRKRTLYLCFLAEHIQQNNSDLSTCLEFSYDRGNPLKPILKLSNPEKNKHVTFAIHLTADENTYKLVRFIPLRNNVRSGVIRGTPDKSEGDQCATPHYNSSILEDFVHAKNEKYIMSAFDEKNNLRDGVILLKVWLKQRGLDEGYSGFSGYLATILIAYLIHSRKMNSGVSSYQLVRIVWTYLSNSTWDEPGNGASLHVTEAAEPNQPSLEDFHRFFNVVFVDLSGYLNLCANLSEDIYKRIKLEAKIALNLLENTAVNSFQCLFMSKIPIHLQYDHFLNIKVKKKLIEVLDKKSSTAEILDFCSYWYPRLLNLVSDLLRRGLGNRIISICPVAENPETWNVKEDPKCNSKHKTLTFGLILNPKEALDVVIKGPQANEPEALEFRNFWGEKSQLRRFKDGSITEACVWAPSGSCLTRKRMISQEIVTHLLCHHLKVSEDSVLFNYLGNQLNCEITLRETGKGIKFPDGYDTEMMSLNVVQEFDALSKILRGLEDLPLEITAVQGISSIFRYCDPIDNLPTGYCTRDGDLTIFYGKVIYEGVIQLSVSGKWPDNLEAIEKLKQAFYIELADKLSKSGVKFTRVSRNAVEILKDGFIFRFQLAHAKDLMLRKQVMVNGIVKQKDSPESLQFEKDLFILPRLSSALNGIHQQFNAFGPTVCLAKKWLYSQLFDQYVWPDECTELLVASMFTKNGPSLPPFQPQTGFLRFLHLVGFTNWQNEMILVNFNESLTSEETSQIEANFLVSRDSYPPLTIVTSFDSTKHSIWSKSAPILQVLVKVSLLAKQILDSLEKNLISGLLEMEKIFRRHHFDSFNLIIKMNPREVHFETENLQNEIQHKRLPAGFDPVKLYLDDLRSSFNSVALFFTNPLKRDFIGVLWKPNVATPTDFKISQLAGHDRRSDGQIHLNLEKIVKDFEILGEGLVTEIVKN